jgi:SulP family sulfate permease
MRSQLVAIVRDLAKDTIAGLVASIVLIANIVSFGALMFPGELSGGMPVAIWAMLIGSSVGGVWIALATSLPPLTTGIDSPTGAVLVLLSAITGSAVLAGGGSPASAVQTVMLIFTSATLVSGTLLFIVGSFRWGAYFRFVPYFVVGGFLAATGWFLVAGGLRMVDVTLADLQMEAGSLPAARFASAVAVLVVLLAVRRYIRWALAMPAALLTMCVGATVALHLLGLSGREHGWYLPSIGTLSQWLPFAAAAKTHLTWPMIVALLPEFLAVSIVALISLVSKVSSLEVARHTAGNLDREFRAHGIANVIATPLGGIACSLQIGSSRLLDQAGGVTRMSGVVCAIVLGAVAVADFDLPGLIPIPIVAGLVFYLGYTFLFDALSRPYVQHAWMDLLLAIAIMIVCIRYGYLVGVLVGVIGACVHFALRYARLGVVRRHATRVAFASYVSRSAEASTYLRESGDAIQIYWLAGYIFFGSSESVFERIRADIETLEPRKVSYVVLDFAMVSGADSSAVASLAKLRNLCDRQGTTLVFCSLSPANRAILKPGGFFGGRSRHQSFEDLNVALTWCEDRLLAEVDVDRKDDLAGFEAWLSDQIGPAVNARELMRYFARKDTDGPEVLYREGEAADTLDLVAVGNLSVDIATGANERLRVRRIATHTVLGEMGFVRRSVRSATVSSDGPATIFTLTRAEFARMRRERPDLADAFDDFIKRTLADRMDAANRAAAALAG